LVVGVGKDPYSVPSVRGAKVGSWNTVPFRVIPDLMEAPENFVQSSRAKVTNVLDDRVVGLDFFDDPVELIPETTSAP
jgi:hypothetical protein